MRQISSNQTAIRTCGQWGYLMIWDLSSIRQCRQWYPEDLLPGSSAVDDPFKLNRQTGKLYVVQMYEWIRWWIRFSKPESGILISVHLFIVSLEVDAEVDAQKNKNKNNNGNVVEEGHQANSCCYDKFWFAWCGLFGW